VRKERGSRRTDYPMLLRLESGPQTTVTDACIMLLY
jgi:hypothetical protein